MVFPHQRAQYLFDLVSVDLVVSLNGNSPPEKQREWRVVVCVRCWVPFIFVFSLFKLFILDRQHARAFLFSVKFQFIFVLDRQHVPFYSPSCFYIIIPDYMYLISIFISPNRCAYRIRRAVVKSTCMI